MSKLDISFSNVPDMQYGKDFIITQSRMAQGNHKKKKSKNGKPRLGRNAR
jgi:hypothetical protein